MSTRRTIHITWRGPFGWPKFEGDLPSIPDHPGLYLQTFEFGTGYLICNPGITTRPIRMRLNEHTRKFMNGDYHVLSMPSIHKGLRKLIWRGWDPSPERRAAFNRRKPVILAAVHRQLADYRVFVADVGTDKRILHRIEAAIMNHFYNHPNEIFRKIPDRNMHREPRLPSEQPITAINGSACQLHGLPSRLVI